MTDTKKQSGEQASSPDLKQLEAVLNAREQELDAKEASLKEREEKLNGREAIIADKEQELNDREELLSAREAALPKIEQPEKPKKGLKFTFRESNYKFSDDAPQSIRVMGEVMTQKEIAEDEEVLVHLIGGNSGLIEKL